MNLTFNAMPCDESLFTCQCKKQTNKQTKNKKQTKREKKRKGQKAFPLLLVVSSDKQTNKKQKTKQKERKKEKAKRLSHFYWSFQVTHLKRPVKVGKPFGLFFFSLFLFCFLFFVCLFVCFLHWHVKRLSSQGIALKVGVTEPENILVAGTPLQFSARNFYRLEQ